MLPSEPIIVVAVCVAAICSYISEEVCIKLWCRLQRRVHGYAIRMPYQCHRFYKPALKGSSVCVLGRILKISM